MKSGRIALACLLILLSGSTFAGAKCRSGKGQVIHTNNVCPVGTVVEEYTNEDSSLILWPNANAPRLSINIRDSDVRTALSVVGDELFPGRLYLDESVSGNIELREFNIPADQLFLKILDIKSLDVMKIRHNYYVFPATMGRRVAASMATLKGL